MLRYGSGPEEWISPWLFEGEENYNESFNCLALKKFLGDKEINIVKNAFISLITVEAWSLGSSNLVLYTVLKSVVSTLNRKTLSNTRKIVGIKNINPWYINVLVNLLLLLYRPYLVAQTLSHV